MTTRCQPPSRNLHPQRLLLATVTLAIASATLPASAQTGAQSAVPQATQQLRAVPPAPRQPNYVMLDAKPAADPEEAFEAAPKDANHVGLKLHGHWDIDVLNPDHSIAHHHAFENSLNSFYGANLILGLMSGYFAAGNPAIIFTGSPGPCLPTNYQGQGSEYCEIVRSTTIEPGLQDCSNNQVYCATTLTFTYNPFTGGNNFATPTLVLTGSITANQAGSITSVVTEWSACQVGGNTFSTSSTTSPASCQASTSAGPMIEQTTAANPSSISVTSGQIVQITVTYTIS